jgi:hypothetical protein
MNFAKSQLVHLRNRLPMPVQRGINLIAFHCLISSKERKLWNERLSDTLACRDNHYIPRHIEAGKVRNGIMTMHNGTRIHAGSYYGFGSQRILQQNKGCHEPQEERVFAQVLERMTAGSVMLELGSYWAFYSLWFATHVPQAVNYMVEPDAGNLLKGRMNFELNQQHGEFIQAMIGAIDKDLPEGRMLSVDGIMQSKGIKHLHILHCDIQGYELDMIRGSNTALDEQRIDYLFISTHSDELHSECCTRLRNKGYHIVQSIDLQETYSHDGLIVAERPSLVPLERLSLDKKNRKNSD